ncbi:sporulation YhaL family protein [Evansella sp. AB-rgal1]|uniref:sporulation YhaL family protein n=1 Tax=Evansella sp. AB-rgal1 TaxID=3242696 RepID=UPI00359D0BF5
MNPITIIFSLIGVLFLAFVVRLLSLTSVGGMVVSAPWWVYVIYLGILFSAVMFVYSLIEEKRKEHKLIEEEGERFLTRFKERNTSKSVLTDQN